MARFVALFALVVVLAVVSVKASPRPTGTPPPAHPHTSRPAAPEYLVTIRRNSPGGNLQLVCKPWTARPSGSFFTRTFLQTSFSEGQQNLLASITVNKMVFRFPFYPFTTPVSAARNSETDA